MKGGMMAQQERREGKDLLARLADAGEEAIQKLVDVPGGRRVRDALTGMRDRVDELQRQVKGLRELEQRVEALERKLAEAGKKTPRKTTSESPRTPAQPS